LRAFAFLQKETAGMAIARVSRHPLGRSRFINAIVAGAIVSAWVATPAAAQSADSVYKGKQIKMIIPSGAGGGYDSYARSLARHLERHIPGNPNIINQNMPAASGMAATNWGYNIAPKDGSVILSTYNALLLEPLMGNSSVQYDPREFEWVGSMGKQQQICVTWHTSPIKSIDDAKKREVIVSATGATGNSATMPKLLNTTLGTKFKVVIGYTTAESRLAVERGEAEGICGLSFSTLKASNAEWIDNKRINVLVQTGNTPQPGLEKVPLLLDLVSDPDNKKALELLAYPEELGRPFYMPPGTPKTMVAIIRKAFDEAMKDPQFLAEAEKLRLEIDPIQGEPMAQMVKQAYATPKSAIEKAIELRN
jgi:tripartite-type tricarboxylate transporter receptor subunit TctC